LIIIYRNCPSDQCLKPNYECIGVICGNHSDLGDEEHTLEIPSGKRYKAIFGKGLVLNKITQYSIIFDDTDWIETEWFQILD